MNFKYSVDDIPAKKDLISLGITWAIVATTFVVILGSVVANIFTPGSEECIAYIQKLMFLTGVAIIVQILFGHKLPAMFGPAAILLVAAVASSNSSINAFSTSLIIGGVICIVISYSKILTVIVKLFTDRVTATILMLVSVTLLPTILELIISPSQPGNILQKLIFAICLIFLMFIAARYLRGFFKSTLYLWVLIIGSISAFIIWGYFPSISTETSLSLETLFSFRPELSVSILIPIIICYFALMANEIGSVKSVAGIVNKETDIKQIKKTISISGLMNSISGFFGVAGGANYSISTGIILDNKNASKYPIILGGIIIIVLSFIPPVIGILVSVPSVVIGCLLLYIMTMQLSAAFVLLDKSSKKEGSYIGGIITGFTILIAVLVSFIPPEYVLLIPVSLQPFVTNGFVIGTMSLMFLEHVVFRHKNEKSDTDNYSGEHLYENK